MDPESGLDAIRNIGITNGRIAILSEDSLVGKQSIVVKGLVVAPGFIDLHAHGQNEESYSLMVRDGVTTAFELEVGTADVEGWYKEREGRQLINYGVSVGHIPVRMKVLGDQGSFLPSGHGGSQAASEEEIIAMQQGIEQGLKLGAVGVGFGLAYTPAATTAEFERMLEVAKKGGAPSFLHMRSGEEGIREAIAAVEHTGAPLHIVHINSSGSSRTAEYLGLIQEAVNKGLDVTTEAYPYEAGMTMIESALFDDWEKWDDKKFGIHQWVATGEFLTRETFGRYRKLGGEVIIHDRTEDMTRDAIRSPLTMIASDGFFRDGKGHPRTSGTYSKVLGKYVREEGLLTLMDAIRRMSLEPARRLEKYVPSMANKGRIREGADADITVFDPSTVIDRSTFESPGLPSKGIQYVIVNGALVVEEGELTSGVKAGTAIRNPPTSKSN